MNPELKKQLDEVKKSVLVYDIETSSSYPDTGEPINIATDFEDYVKFAKVKWFGMYSYKYDEYVNTEVYGSEDTIKSYIAKHDFICGFNSEAFDTPIMFNNDLFPEGYKKQIDVQQILGNDKYKGHKDRGSLMGFKFKKNSLKVIAETMKLETQKGDIDYNIFFQDTYTDEQREEIIKYLEADVKATKQMFDKLWDYWMPFTEFLTDEDVLNLSWIKSSIASLTYKAACKVIGVEPTYGEKSDITKEEMGGRVIEPKYEEARNVWYVDFTSLYPHIFAMFNLFAEVDFSYGCDDGHGHSCSEDDFWHGNDLFTVKGYYDITKQHPLSEDIKSKLKLRKEIKANDPGNPQEHAIKIFLNSLYGAARSPIFEQIHTENCGWDCCWLGQQINELAEDMMTDFGFETIAGDTDSIFVVLKKDIPHPITEKGMGTEEDYVRFCLKEIVKKILDNVPFPADTFDIDIENFLHYVMWPFSDQPIEWNGDEKMLNDFLEEHTDMTFNERFAVGLFNKENTKIGHNVKNLKKRLLKVRKGKKKNYCYLYETDVKIIDDFQLDEVSLTENGIESSGRVSYRKEMKFKLMGLPIKKDGATILGPKIYHEHLEQQIIKQGHAKFDKSDIEELIQIELATPEGLGLLAREYKVKPLDNYKNPSQIQAQISLGYFNGQDGVISLIKNKVCGKAGKTAKYCTVQEAVDNKLTINDLDLEKVHNELEPFVKGDSK